MKDRGSTVNDDLPTRDSRTDDFAATSLYSRASRDPLARVAFAFSAILFIVLLAILVIVRAQRNSNLAVIASMRSEVDSTAAAHELGTFFAESSSEFRGYLITGHRHHWEQSQSEGKEFQHRLEIVSRDLEDAEARDLVSRIRTTFDEISKARAESAASIEANRPLTEIAVSYSRNGFEPSQTMIRLLDRLQERKLELMNEKIDHARRESRTILLLMVGFSVVCLTFALVLVWWFTRRLSFSYWRMKQAMDKFRMAVKISDDLIWEWDLRAQKIQLFEGLFSRFNYGLITEPGLLTAKIHPDDRDRVVSGLEKAIDSEDSELWSDSYRLQRNDGSYADVVGRALIARDQFHRPLSVLGALIDTSELSQAIRARDEMSGVISHELKNPVASIEMAADLLERELAGVPISDTARSALARMKPISHRMNRLLRDLLDITRIEGRTLAVEIGTYDAGKIIDEVMFQFRSPAKEKKITLSCVIPEALPFLHCDRDRMLQVLSNLVGNAVKFTPAFGRITLKATARKGFVEFEISDTGPGIEDAHLERVFDRFWRASRGRKDSSGLGLAIAKGLVQAQGGKIWVESAISRGSSFHFTVPSAPNADALSEPARASARGSELPRTERSAALPVQLHESVARGSTPPPRSLAGIRILLVDDSQDALFLTKTLLELAGAEVIEAESAQAALFVLKTFTPHILLTDIEMPGKTGIELLHEIRDSEQFQLPIFKNLIAVAMTAHEARSELLKITNAGFDCVLLKPISYDQVVNTLTSLLQKNVPASEPQPPRP